MELLDCLKEEYQWKKITLINEALIETEQGNKRLRYWSNKSLLDWHIKWRDSIQVTPNVLADRMIRNKEKEAATKWKEGWITVHDDISAKVPKAGHEQLIAQIITAMIDYGLNVTDAIQPKEHNRCLYKDCYAVLPRLEERQRFVLRSYLQEAESRMNKSSALSQYIKEEQLPLLDPIKRDFEIRQVHQLYIWYGSAEFPERGYRSVVLFLHRWLKERGEESTSKLLDELVSGLSRDQALYLVAECLHVSEFDMLLKELERNESIENRKIDTLIEVMIKDWEITKQLVQVVSTTIDRKKKVLAE